MSGKMSVHAYRVIVGERTPPLSFVLNEILNTPLNNRIRPVNGIAYRIEHIELKDDGYWLIDFGRFRESSGPAAAARDRPARDLEIATDEEFFEESAALYDESRQYLLMQYNHHGAKINSLESYLNGWDGKTYRDYEFKIKLDENAERALENATSLKRLEFSIDPRIMSRQDRESNQALESILEATDESGGAKITVTISAEKQRKGTLNAAGWELLNSLKNIVGRGDTSITKLQAGIYENEDSSIDIIDLISEKLVHKFNDIDVGAGKRLDKNSRFHALYRAYRGWDNRLR